MAKTATKDMTVGNPLRLIVGFAIPLMFSLVLQQIYSLVDTVIVGRVLGVSALGAVGSTGSINFLVLGFCTGACTGFAVPVAQRFGAKDQKAMQKFVANSIWLAVILGVIMTILTVVLCKPTLEWMHTPEDILEDAYAYIVVIFIGIPAIMFYNLLAGFIRSVGDSKTPLVIVLLTSVINIFLDIYFMMELKMGVAGAAWATVLSQLIAGFLCLFVILKRFPILHVHGETWKWDLHCVKTLLYMGLPMGLQYSITAIGSIILQTSINGLGSVVVSSLTAGQKISMFFVCPIDAIATTMTTYGGQNVGAKRLSRIGKGVWAALALSAVYCILAFLVIDRFSVAMLQLFVDVSLTEVFDYATMFLRYNTGCYILLAILEIYRFLIQGMGFSMISVFAGVAEMIARIFAALVFVPYMGYLGVCLASPFAWVLACAFLIPTYCYIMNKLYRQYFGSKEAGIAYERQLEEK